MVNFQIHKSILQELLSTFLLQLLGILCTIMITIFLIIFFILKTDSDQHKYIRGLGTIIWVTLVNGFTNYFTIYCVNIKETL